MRGAVFYVHSLFMVDCRPNAEVRSLTAKSVNLVVLRRGANGSREQSYEDRDLTIQKPQQQGFLPLDA